MRRCFDDLDTLDVRILREVIQGPPTDPLRRESKLVYRKMARKLGVSEGTVRARVGKLSESGFLKSWRLLPNPHLLGLCWEALGLEVSPALSKTDVIEKMLLVDGLLVLENHHSNYVGLVFCYEDQEDLSKKVSLFKKIAGANAWIASEMPFPECDLTLSKTDWKILQVLVKAGKSHAQVAREVGIVARSVKRRVLRMEKAGAVLTLYDIDVEALDGAILADLEVKYSGHESRNDSEKNVFRIVNDYLYFVGLWTDYSLFSLILPNVPRSSGILKAVKETRGVEYSRIEIVDSHIDVSGSMKRYVDRKLA